MMNANEPQKPPVIVCKTKDDAKKIANDARKSIAEETKKALKKEILNAALKGEYYISKKMHENINSEDQDKIVEDFKAAGFEVKYKYNCFGSEITIYWVD